MMFNIRNDPDSYANGDDNRDGKRNECAISYLKSSYVSSLLSHPIFGTVIQQRSETIVQTTAS